MKILFFGTSEFGLPALEKLKESDFDLIGVVTGTDKPVGRKKELTSSPVKKWALKNNVPVFQPEKLVANGEPFDKLREEAIDVFVVASYGKIIPKEILDIPKFGALNIHPSLLPKYRGPSPMPAAILNGDKKTGVTIIKMDEKMDHGDIVADIKYQISNIKITYQELHDELAKLGADLLIKILPEFVEGKIQLQKQDHDQATFTKIIKKEDARIVWGKSAVEIDRMIRAYGFWETPWTKLDDKILKIYKADVSTRVSTNVSTSGKVSVEGNKMMVTTKEGFLEIQELQLEGKQKLSATEFIRGYRNLNGKLLK